MQNVHTVRTRRPMHARLCPPFLLPTHFHPFPPFFPPFPLHPTPSTHVGTSMLAPAPFPCTHRVRTRPPIHARSCPPILPHRAHTSPHPCSLMPLSLAPKSAPVRASTLAHQSLPPPISNVSLAPTPSAHVRASTLAHAQWSFPCPFPTFPLHPHAPTPSAHVRASTLAPAHCTHKVRTRPRIDAR